MWDHLPAMGVAAPARRKVDTCQPCYRCMCTYGPNAISVQLRLDGPPLTKDPGAGPGTGRADRTAVVERCRHHLG